MYSISGTIYTETSISKFQETDIVCIRYRVQFAFMHNTISNNTLTDIEVTDFDIESFRYRNPISKLCSSISKFLQYRRFWETSISKLVISISNTLHLISNKLSISKTSISNKPSISGVARFQNPDVLAGHVSSLALVRA